MSDSVAARISERVDTAGDIPGGDQPIDLSPIRFLRCLIFNAALLTSTDRFGYSHGGLGAGVPGRRIVGARILPHSVDEGLFATAIRPLDPAR